MKGIRFISFVAAFQNPVIENQMHGAEALYKLLKNMHEVDSAHFEWDETVSSDIESPLFSYSVGNDAFFVPLLYPFASSKARLSEYTYVVFNAHLIFEKLRRNGSFEQLRDAIRARQEQVSDNLQDYGDLPEIIQYPLVDGDPETQAKDAALRGQILGSCPFKK